MRHILSRSSFVLISIMAAACGGSSSGSSDDESGALTGPADDERSADPSVATSSEGVTFERTSTTSTFRIAVTSGLDAARTPLAGIEGFAFSKERGLEVLTLTIPNRDFDQDFGRNRESFRASAQGFSLRLRGGTVAKSINAAQAIKPLTDIDNLFDADFRLPNQLLEVTCSTGTTGAGDPFCSVTARPQAFASRSADVSLWGNRASIGVRLEKYDAQKVLLGFGSAQPFVMPSGMVWLQQVGSNANLTNFGVFVRGTKDRSTNVITYDRELTVWSDDKDTTKATLSSSGAELTVGGATRTLLEPFAQSGGIPGLVCTAATCTIKN